MRRYRCAAILFCAAISACAAETPVDPDRDSIVGSYRATLDALRRGDADSALRMDTDDWVSITAGEKPRTKQEMEIFIRRDIASMKPPSGWSATWQPDYEHHGTTTGIQIYGYTRDGDTVVVLCLVGSTHPEVIDGVRHDVWRGSHVRDTWIRTTEGWKRRKHEKLTINERMIDGRAADRPGDRGNGQPTR